jgi:hypothetical protein
MPNARRAPPPRHVVVVDTNILWDKDKKLPVCLAFDEFWKQNSSLIPMELQLPEVVFGELHFQQTTSALKALANVTDNFTELSGITTSLYSHKCNESTIKSQVKAKLEKWLHGHSGNVAPSPISSIDWPSVVDAAIWRKPPFTFDAKDKNNEKGFRDAIILETLAHICDSAGAGKTIIFVCNDDLLRTTAESRLRASKALLAFESLNDFEAYIKLTQQQLTNAFVKAIQNHARSKFYTKGDQNCIYNRFKLPDRVRKDFASDLALPDANIGALGLLAQSAPSTPWNSVREMFWIRSTQFTRLDGAREFHWTTRLDLARLYENGPSSGLIAAAMPPFRRIRVLSVDVKWKANVKADGRFHDIDVLTLEKKDAQGHDGTDDNLKEWRLA